MKRLAVRAACLAPLAPVMGLVFLNRGSEKIVGAAVPLVALWLVFALVPHDPITREKIVGAAVPLVASITTLWLVFAFARLDPITRVFPVSFSYRVSDSLPLIIPLRPFPLHSLPLVDQLQQGTPVARPGLEGYRTRSLMYHELLQKTLMDWLRLEHPHHWALDVVRFRSPMGGVNDTRYELAAGAERKAVRIIPNEHWDRLLGSNRFATLGTRQFLGEVALPPRTTVTVRPPTLATLIGEIRLRNSMTEITVETLPSGGLSGLGVYSSLLGLEPLDLRYGTVQFVVRAKATFSALLVGNPEMALYRDWAIRIIEGMQQQFDEQSISQRTIENFLLYRHLPGVPGVPNLSVAIMKAPISLAPRFPDAKTEERSTAGQDK